MANHSHAGHMPSSGKALVISAWLTGVYFVIELAVGLWTGSIAVLSDAFHTLSAVGGVLVAIIAPRREPADMMVRHIASHTSMNDNGPEASAATPFTSAPRGRMVEKS